jgi:hypothetical protein
MRCAMRNATSSLENGASVSAAPAYSEWRPVCWRVTTAVRSYGLFNSHRQASRFADGLLLYPEHADSIRITRVESASHLIWQGDSIGLGSDPAIIQFLDDFGILRTFTVADALNHRKDVDPRGLGRIVSALRLMAGLGELHSEDLAAWREVEDEFPIYSRIEEVL